MSKSDSDKQNRLDQLWSEFAAKFKYEILASLALMALLGGIVLAVMVFGQKNEEIKVISAQDVESKESDRKVMVDIAGAVVSPDVYEMGEGSRIKDVLDQAGGVTGAADQDWMREFLNQAETVKDGQKIFIPEKGEQGTGEGRVDGSKTKETVVSGQAGATTQSTKISLNRATLTELDSLPGIGPAYAQNIINARPFSSIEELLNVDGIGPKRFEEIKDRVTVY